MRGVHFDDSEEERMKGFDEWLNEGVDAGVNGEPIIEHVTNNEAPSEPNKKMFITEEMGKEHVIEDSYMTDELDNGGDDDNCDERPYVIRFNVEDSLSKDFSFKVGMEFSSLHHFKDVILEHNVLSDRDVSFEKKKMLTDVEWYVRIWQNVTILSCEIEF